MNLRLTTLLVIIAALAVSRLLVPVPNVSPIAAMALFAGAHFADRRTALLSPLGALLLSDLLFFGLHATLLFVYGAFALTVLIGFWLRAYPGLGRVACAALASSVLFFLITNFGAWLADPLYPKTAEGLAAAYTAGIPFFRYTVMGDLVFSLLLFGGFRLAEKTLPALRSGRYAPVRREA